MITKFYKNMGWFDSKTNMLVMQAKYKISCVELKFDEKLSNLIPEYTS